MTIRNAHSRFLLPVNVRQSAATAAVATVWAMRATIGGSLQIRRIRLCPFFDPASGAAIVDYRICRFSTATPTGGAALTVIKAANALPATGAIGDARVLDTGLAVAGVVFETEFASIRGSGSQGGQTVDLNFESGTPFVLAFGEGLAVRLHTTATIGQGISGFVDWDEG